MVQLKDKISSYLDTKLFNLEYISNESETALIMKMKTGLVTTSKLPHILSRLRKLFPEVLNSECFNDKNLPFEKEVVKTEIGHLFEHILIESVCQAKVGLGEKNTVVNGRTDWDWSRDPRGLFRIFVDIGQKDRAVFNSALNKSVSLTCRLLGSN